MTKHIILAEIAAAILVALIFAVVCGRARGDAPPPPWTAPQVETTPEPRAPLLPQRLPHFPQTASPTPTLPPLLLRPVARPPIAHLAPPPSFLRRQEPPTSTPTRFPNSSLPPSRGEVRWGVGGHELSPPSRARPNRSPRSPSAQSRAPQSLTPLPLRHSCAPLPSFLRPLSVIPAPPLRHSCAGRNHAPPRASHHAHQPPSSHPFPNSSLPPSRGEVRWGVGGHEPSPPVARAPIAHPTPPPPSRARPNRPPHFPLHPVARPQIAHPTPPPPSRAPSIAHPTPPPSFLRRQEPTLRRGYLTTLTSRPALTPSPIHPSPLPGGRLGGGWEVTSRLRPVAPPIAHPPSTQSRAPQSLTPLPLRRSHPFSTIPAPPSVIPAQAGNPHTSDIRRRSSALSEVDEGQPAPSSTSSSS